MGHLKPGKETSQYLFFVINNIIIWGSTYLIILCLYPIMIQDILENNKMIHINGISFLIIITITMEFVNNINNIIIKNKYITYKNIIYSIGK